MTIANSTGTVASFSVTRYPVNIRLTLPFIRNPLFLTLIVGPERRTPERRVAERRRHPLTTGGNMATLIAGSVVLAAGTWFTALAILGS